MKTKLQKEKEIEILHKEFEESPNALLVAFQGIKVADDERLRRELRQASISYRVVKNTLAIRAADQRQFYGFDSGRAFKDRPGFAGEAAFEMGKRETGLFIQGCRG